MKSDTDLFTRLRAVTSTLRTAANIEEAVRASNEALCNVFEAERFTLYLVSGDGSHLYSETATGLQSGKRIKVSLNLTSVAGYAARVRKVVNIRDVYDQNELGALQPPAKFLEDADAKTGYHTREMLVAPVLDDATGKVLGVVQILNQRDGQPFSKSCEDAIEELCQALCAPLDRRAKQAARRAEKLREEEAARNSNGQGGDS